MDLTMGQRPLRSYKGTAIVRKRVTPDFYGVNVFCLEDFDPTGITVRATVGKGMA
jgi:hypothetical protein